MYRPGREEGRIRAYSAPQERTGGNPGGHTPTQPRKARPLASAVYCEGKTAKRGGREPLAQGKAGHVHSATRGNSFPQRRTLGDNPDATQEGGHPSQRQFKHADFSTGRGRGRCGNSPISKTLLCGRGCHTRGAGEPYPPTGATPATCSLYPPGKKSSKNSGTRKYFCRP